MKVKSFFIVLTYFCLFFGCTVSAEETVSTEIVVECSTKEELTDFLQSDTGGIITLTEDILWDDTYNCLPIITNPVIVEMDRYKIQIPEECLMSIQGPVTFRGEGDVLFDVEGALNLSYGTEVHATGEGAVAIQAMGNSSMQFFVCKVTASGANAIAIRSDEPVTVQLSHVEGTEKSIEAPEITLDTSNTMPKPDKANVIERVPAIDRNLRLYGITLSEEGSEEEYKEKIFGYGKLQYAFINPEDGNAIGGSFQCVWENVPMWPVKKGDYTLSVYAADLPEWFPAIVPSFEIPLHIVDKNTLWLNVGFADPYFGAIAMQFEPNVPDENAQVTLFYSTDNGESWKNIKEDYPDSTIDRNMIDIVGLTPDTDYWFYAEVLGGDLTGISNIIYHPNYINNLDINFSDGGGDRDEDDFEDQGENPPAGVIIPPPDEEAAPPDEKRPSPDEAGSSPSDEEAAPPDKKRPSPDETGSSPDEEKQSQDEVGLSSDQAAPVLYESDPSSDEMYSESLTDTSSAKETDRSVLDSIIVILSLSVISGIAGILILRRKGGH